MATCPHCGEFLDEHHHCPARRRAHNVGMTALAMLIGAVLSTMTLYAISDRPAEFTVIVGVAAGMIIGNAVWTNIRH
jgi:hypothetical protein